MEGGRARYHIAAIAGNDLFGIRFGLMPKAARNGLSYLPKLSQEGLVSLWRIRAIRINMKYLLHLLCLGMFFFAEFIFGFFLIYMCI